MLSYARGPVFPVLEKSIGEIFAEAVKAHPAREAVVLDDHLRLTYRELTK
jgi:non-ribosomal peptide synthetase component F